MRCRCCWIPRPKDSPIIIFGLLVCITLMGLMINYTFINRKIWQKEEICKVSGYGTICPSSNECNIYTFIELNTSKTHYVQSNFTLTSHGKDALRYVRARSLVKSNFRVNYTSSCWVLYEGVTPTVFIWSIDPISNFMNDVTYVFGIIIIGCFAISIIIMFIILGNLYKKWRKKVNNEKELITKGKKAGKPKIYVFPEDNPHIQQQVLRKFGIEPPITENQSQIRSRRSSAESIYSP